MSVIIADPNDPILSGMVGASVFWKLADSVNHAGLVMALDEAEFNHIPEPSTPSAALLRYLSREYANRDCLVKTTKHLLNLKHPSYGVFPRTASSARGDGFDLSWTVSLKDTKVGDGEARDLLFTDCPGTIMEELCLGFSESLEELGGTEQSAWLTAFVKNVLRGFPFATGNGTYFIGPEFVPVWRKLRDVVSKYGIVLYEVPAMRSDQAMEAIMASLQAYAEKTIKEYDDELEAYEQARVQGDQKRAIQARVISSRTAVLKEKLELVATYEKMFDVSLEPLRESFNRITADFYKLTVIGRSA